VPLRDKNSSDFAGDSAPKAGFYNTMRGVLLYQK